MPQPDCRPLADTACKSKDLEEEFLVYDPDGDQVHVLNEVAREIFLLCDGSRHPEDIAVLLTDGTQWKRNRPWPTSTRPWIA